MLVCVCVLVHYFMFYNSDRIHGYWNIILFLAGIGLCWYMGVRGLPESECIGI